MAKEQPDQYSDHSAEQLSQLDTGDYLVVHACPKCRDTFYVMARICDWCNSRTVEIHAAH